MRMALIGVAVTGAAACGPEAPPAGSVAQAMDDAANPGALWPVMLAHCLRAPDCDPMGDFGQGVGQASGVAGEVTYFVESAEAGQKVAPVDGATITVSLHAARGRGGAAGRPLAIDETAPDLRVTLARRSTLSIEYRRQGGDEPQPYSLIFVSAHIAFQPPGQGTFKTPEEMARAAEQHVGSMRWPDGGEGARIEVAAQSGVVLAGYSTGMAAAETLEAKAALQRGFQPWVFDVRRILRDGPEPALMAAVEAGETLGLKISAPDGGVMLQDAFYTGGYAEALREASEALADPELARTIPERCTRFDAEQDAFWKIADVTAALRVCDPRTVEQRRQASAPAAAVPDR